MANSQFSIPNSQFKKFISPGAWFSMIYPTNWSESEDSENTFLFYDPVNWNGNFRISAYRKDAKFSDAKYFGKDSVQQELKTNETAALVKVGRYECAYSKEMFQEEGTYYVSHIWIVNAGNVAFECSFTVPKGGEVTDAQNIIESLEVRPEGQKYPAEIIPIRVAEISLVNEAYDWTVSTVKKQLKKDFQGVEEDLEKMQTVVESGSITPKQKEAWLSLGITICVILTNELEGFEWMTLIDGNREAPVLQYTPTEQVIDPMRLVWSKIKAGEPCNVVEEYKNIIEKL